MYERHKKICIISAIILLASISLASASNTALTGHATAEDALATKEQTLNALMQSEETIKSMADQGLGIKLVNDTLLKAKRYYIGQDKTVLEYDISAAAGAKRAYLQSLLSIAEHTSPYESEKLDYAETISLAKDIEARKKQAYSILDTISLLKQQEAEYRASNVNTSYAKSLLDEGQAEFDAERYSAAETYLSMAETELDKDLSENRRAQELVDLSKTFISKYWPEIVIAIVALAITGLVTAKKIRKYVAKRKLASLKIELQSITRLIKQAQEDYLKNKKISKTTYETRFNKLMARSTKIKHTMPVLESIVSDKKPKDEKTGILEVRP